MAEHFEKFPSFNMFPADWIAGTAEMSPEQAGAFIRLLCYSWEQSPPCTLLNDENRLASLAGVSIVRWRKISGPVMSKFEETDDGRLRNPKLFRVYENQVNIRRERSKAGSKGGRPAKPKPQQTESKTKANEKQTSKQKETIRYPLSVRSSDTTSLKETDGVHAPRNGQPESVGNIVARITPAVNE